MEVLVQGLSEARTRVNYEKYTAALNTFWRRHLRALLVPHSRNERNKAESRRASEGLRLQ